MKKAFVCILSLLIVFSLFAACNKTGGNTEPAESVVPAGTLSVQTIGEALALLGDDMPMSATYDDVYICVFEKDGAYWRLTAQLSAEESAALSALDILADDYDEKEKELLSPLAITKCENLNELLLSDDELNALVGKTGEDLLNDGWTSGMGYNLDTMEFYLERPPFSYTVIFESDGQLENTEDFDVSEAIRPLKVKSVVFDGIGNSATDKEE